MIKLYNTKVLISSDSPLIYYCRSNLKVTEKTKEGDLVTYYLYDKSSKGDISFFAGLLYLLPQINLFDVSKSTIDDKIIDHRTNMIKIDQSLLSDEEISHLLDGIVLRPDQVLAVRKLLTSKRGILQLSTGSGKTEIFSAFLKLVYNKLGYYQPTIILEPSLLLVKSTIDRLTKYGIPSNKITNKVLSTMDRSSGICVTHPSALTRFIDSSPDSFKNIKILISDEGHHLQARTWQKVMSVSTSLEYSLAFSATVFDKESYDVMNLTGLSYAESIVIQATGPLLIDIPPSYYISAKILATPKLYRLASQANELSYNSNNWKLINQYVIESDKRSALISNCAAFMANNNYKVLILVNTKRHALKLLSYISTKFNLYNIVRCSFGTGKFYSYDTNSKSEVEVSKEEDTMNMYKTGEIKILIGTSHIYEGADIPNLDSVIIAGSGRGVRRLVQGIGRALRITKTGNYAHIIDFTDSENGVLSYQSLLRLQTYCRLVNNNTNDIYSNISFSEFKALFTINEYDNIINKEDD